MGMGGLTKKDPTLRKKKREGRTKELGYSALRGEKTNTPWKYSLKKRKGGGYLPIREEKKKKGINQTILIRKKNFALNARGKKKKGEERVLIYYAEKEGGEKKREKGSSSFSQRGAIDGQKGKKGRKEINEELPLQAGEKKKGEKGRLLLFAT